MAYFRIKPQSMRKAIADAKRFAKAKKAILAKALGMWMDDTIGEMQEELVRINAIDQGQLVAATTRDPVKQVGTFLKTKGHNDSEHAPVIEWGRAPRSGLPPPLLPLVGWAGRKGIVNSLPRNASFDGDLSEKWKISGAIFRNMKKNKGQSQGKKKPLDPQVRDLIIIRSIARKIYEKGIEGRHPFSTVWDRRSRTSSKDFASLVQLLS